MARIGAAFALAAVVAAGLGAPALAQSPPFGQPPSAQAAQAGDVVTAIVGDQIQFRFIAGKGSEAFRTPADWPVVAVKSDPPVAVAVFQ